MQTGVLTSAMPGLFTWLFVSAALARIWRALGLWREADASDGFVWMPLGLCADLLVAGLGTALVVMGARAVGLVGGIRRQRGAAPVLGAMVGLAHIAWLALNLVSFTLTQAPITFQRARGDEGVRFDAHTLLRPQDVVGAIAFSLTALVLLPLVVRAGRAAARRLSRRAMAALLAIAVCGYGLDTLWFRGRNFGVADHVVLALLSSTVASVLDDAVRPRGFGEGETPADVAALRRARHPIIETGPPPRARAEMRNVVVFFAEGIARKHTSLGGEDTTPNLARRAQESGLDLTRYYAPYHKSIAAIYSAVCADLPPPDGQNIVELNGRIDCGELSEVLAAHGLRAGLFHGGDFGFYDKLSLLGMRSYDVLLDARAMSDPALWEENQWGIDDRATVHHFLQWTDTLDPGDRFGALLIPITAHWPYWIPSDVEPLRPPSSSKNEFLSAVHFLDSAFEALMRGLEERGLAHDTAVIFVADHGETVGERPRASAGRRVVYEPSLHVPMVILAPGMWPPGATSDRLGSHADLLPTVLDLLGLPADPRHHGTSLLEPDRASERLFIAAHNGYRWAGFIDGNRKFFVNTITGAREAYDLAADPDERRNIVELLPADEADTLDREARAFARGHLAAIIAAPRRSDEVDIEARFLEAVAIRVRRPGADGREEVVVACSPAPPPPGAGAGYHRCPDEDEGVFRGRMPLRAAGKHDCLVVRPPRVGVLELEVGPQPWLPLFTRLRLAQTEPLREDGVDEVPVAVWSDSELHNARDVPTRSYVRMPFASPRESVRIHIGGTGPAKRDVCLSLTERGWRNRPLRSAALPAVQDPPSEAARTAAPLAATVPATDAADP